MFQFVYQSDIDLFQIFCNLFHHSPHHVHPPCRCPLQPSSTRGCCWAVPYLGLAGGLQVRRPLWRGGSDTLLLFALHAHHWMHAHHRFLYRDVSRSRAGQLGASNAAGCGAGGCHVGWHGAASGRVEDRQQGPGNQGCMICT